MLLTYVACLTLFKVVIAQDLSVPATWREPNNSRSLSERITIAQDANNVMLSQLTPSNGQFNGIGYWQAANVWSALANQDHITNATQYQSVVTNALETAFDLYSDYDQFQYNDDAMWWATAAVYAYRAYHDTSLLSHAIAVWEHVSQYVVTPSAASSGTLPTKDFSISGECDGASMVGGVFWRPTTDDQSINSVTTGLYIALSAYLAEISGDSTYTNAAIVSASWIENLNINSEGLVLDTVNAHDCTRSPSTWLFTYNSGKYIEGLSVLADVTGNPAWNNLMVNVTAASVKTSAWEGSDGIITEGASATSNNDAVGFKAVFVRGLHEAFVRNAPNADLQVLIQSYIDVQYNALLELAANGSTYSSAWHGPPQSFTSWGQLAALDVLVSAIDTNQ